MKFIWWHGKDLIPFFNRVAAIGGENCKIVLEFSPDKKSADFFVHDLRDGAKEDNGDNGDGPFNFSHICPPDCGPD